MRVLTLALGMLVGCIALTWRLWEVQVIEGPKYAARIATAGEVRVRIAPTRGEIRDRNGVTLARNRAQANVELYLPEIVRSYRAHHGTVPMVEYVAPLRQMPVKMREADIVAIVREDLAPRLREAGLPAQFEAEDLMRHFRTAAEVPFVWLKNADFATMARFSESFDEFGGVQVAMRPVREYVYGALAAHVLGYVGDPLNIAELPDVHDYRFYEPNVEGKAQIELFLDEPLRGHAGVRVMRRDLKGAIEEEVRTEPPQAGDTVYLTLDARIQYIVEKTLRQVGRAGAVVLDPNTGEILAMASAPSFDPNSFIPSIPAKDWERLRKDETDPLVNRAISAYPPGSTFKAVTALAGVSQNLAKTTFSCSGGVTYGNHYFACWKSSGHGRLALSDAIKFSCNAFFYQYGNAAGIEAIDTVGAVVGLGQASRLGLSGEQAGVLPGPEWLKNQVPAEHWSPAQTANVSIGQGYDLVSPLQLALAYSAIANGGTAYYPLLVRKVIPPEGKAVEERPPLADDSTPRIRGRLADVGIGAADLELVRRGFWKVVNEEGGTGGRARMAGVEVAGKTGTAQATRHGHQDTIAWFVCFVPYERPRYTICVMVQGGAHGGSVAAPIAAEIVKETLAMERGDFVPVLEPLPPAEARNPFQMIESLNVESKVAADAPNVSAARKPNEKPVARAKRAEALPGERPAAPPAREGLFQRLFGPSRSR